MKQIKERRSWMKQGISILVAMAMVVASHVPLMGETGQDRLKALEEKIQALESQLNQVKQAFESELNQMKAASSKTKAEEELIEKKGATPVVAFWKNDFFLSTPDENFWMKIRGNLHFDTKFYGGNSNNPTEFDIRRARIDFQGMLYKYLYFRVQPEFADSPYIRNAWVDYEFRDWLHLRAGQMKPPFSTSWWTLDNRVNFLERGAGTPMYPYFDRGWWVWGDLFDETLTWNLSAFTGAGMELEENRGDIDDHKDYVARLFYSPFKNDEASALTGLHLCLEGSLGRQSVPTTRFEKKGYSAAVRDDKFWTWETEDPGEGRIGSRDRWGAELHYIAGPFTLSSEYLVTHYDDIDVFATDGTKVISEDGDISSWSTWVSYFLTGEKKQVSNFGWQQPNPKTNFDPVHLKGTGAWEVLARYTYTDTDECLFDVYRYGDNDYRILEGADKVDEYTLGVSWTWNPMVRWQGNYVHLHGDGIQSGSSSNLAGKNRIDNEDMFGLRMIFKF
jgi:phosphate-selective porin OprO/OprP